MQRVPGAVTMESAGGDDPLCSAVDYNTLSAFLQQAITNDETLKEGYSLEETGR